MNTKLDIEKGIIPLSQFRQESKDFLNRIRKTHEPLILTQNGESAAVVLSPQDYQRLIYERDLFRAIAEGEKDLAEGRTISHEELFKELA